MIENCRYCIRRAYTRDKTGVDFSPLVEGLRRAFKDSAFDASRGVGGDFDYCVVGEILQSSRGFKANTRNFGTKEALVATMDSFKRTP